MKKFVIYLLLLNLISACGSVQESFSLKKKDNEFEKIINKPQNDQSKTVIKKTSIEQSVIEKIK